VENLGKNSRAIEKNRILPTLATATQSRGWIKDDKEIIQRK
jgi:hypothetical protein